MKKHKIAKGLLISSFMVFVLLNCVAYLHAYKFTHFDTTSTVKTKDDEQLAFTEKLKTLALGVNNPRPVATQLPTQAFETIKLSSNKQIECWLIKANNAKGTVILFHGYGGEKSGMLDKATVFLKLGYTTLLVDFMGSGGSTGNQTTIGFYESAEVKTTFDYVKSTGEKNIILFGTSMGAVAILKAEHDYKLNANKLIIECPFGTMLQTVKARFTIMHLPSFPMANLLVFYGGFQNNFNAFNHNPTEYAKGVKCPTLLMYGEKDNKVSRNEIDELFLNLSGTKQLNTYPLAGHENYLINYKDKWTQDVSKFLN
jgi:alpha-beta hydrolase superfamily lysophospholipase